MNTAVMSYEELQAEISRLQRQAEEVREKEKQEGLAKVYEIMDRYGITASDLKLRKSRKVSLSKPKFKNPTTGETWSGRGKRPHWIHEWVSSGKDLDQLRID